MKKKWTPHIIAVLAFVVFIVLGFASASMPKETAETHYNRGIELSERNNWLGAYFAFTDAIELDPDFALAYYRRGMAHLGLNDINYAIDDFSKFIELNPPQLSSGYFSRGLSYKLLGDEQAYTNIFGYETNNVSTSDVSKLTRALEFYNLALSDSNKALELTSQANLQNISRISTQITEVQRKKEEVETALAASTEQTRAIEETNRYDPANFTVIPDNFTPSDYTRIDLFGAASNARNLQIASNREEAIYNQMMSPFMLGGGSWFLEYVSDLTFVRQNGTDITFSSDDNAITQTMSIDQRSGLQAGQKVRVYYEITRSPLTTWDVIAIERR